MLAVTLWADQLLENEQTNCTTAATHHGRVGGGSRQTTTGDASDRATMPGLKCWFNESDGEREKENQEVKLLEGTPQNKSSEHSELLVHSS